MGWITPDVRHKLAILRYWNKIVDMTDTRIPKIIFNYLRGNNEGWAKQTYDIFAQINCKVLFTNNVKILNLREFLIYAQKHLMSQHIVTWKRDIVQKSKLQVYRQYKTEYITENYCHINLKRHQRSLIAKLRLGVLPINVEIGRYTNTPRDERYCPV